LHAAIVLSGVDEGMPLVDGGQEAGNDKRLEFFERDPIVWREHPLGELYLGLPYDPRMPYDFQVVVDAADPHTIADWWAETLGWVVEPSDEAFIRKMISEGYATDDDTKVHDGVLVWREGAAIRHPDGPDKGPRKRVLFQLVPEPKTGKNRMHIDVWVGPENVETECERLAARGATFLHRGRQGPHSWITMADPEGNEFCIA
jgi:hypothetical protein